MKSICVFLTAICLTACASAHKSKSENLDTDELFHRVAKHHQSLISNMEQATGPRLSYEDAAFVTNMNHRKEVTRVIACARAQGGFEDRAVYQRPPRYELHFYFTGEAKQKLSKCTHDPLFVAHSVKYRFDELQAVSEEAGGLLSAQKIEARSEIKTAPHLIFETKPYPPSVLSELPYIKITVETKDLEHARKTLSQLMTKHEFLFVVEGHPYDEIIVTTGYQ